MEHVAIVISFILITPFILAEENQTRYISCKIYTYDGVKDVGREIAVNKIEKLSTLFDRAVKDLNEENIEKLIDELGKLKLLENFSRKY